MRKEQQWSRGRSHWEQKVHHAHSCLAQEWLHMAGGHNKVEYCSGSHLKESDFRSIDLSRAAGLSLRRGLRHTIARVRGVMDAHPPKGSKPPL